jgi:hypothetical protein
VQRRSLLSLVCCIVFAGALAVAAAMPAGAVQPFGQVVTVVQPGGAFDMASGDAVVGSDGMVRGFVEFEGGTLGDDRPITYYEGSGTHWTTLPSPYRGAVMGVAWDGSATYLLYAAGDGIRITKHTASGFTGGRVISPYDGNLSPSGDVVAAGGNWWAVWNEPVGPGGEFAQTDLFQALTLGRGHFHDGINRQRITFDPLMDGNPSLTLAPDGGSGGHAVLAWTRDDGMRGESSAIRFARAAFDGRWSSQLYRTGGHWAAAPDLFTYGPQVFAAYQLDGRIIQATNPPAGVVTNRFRTPGGGPRVASSYGHTFVAWTSLRGQIMVGEATGAGVNTELNLTPTAGEQQLVSISGRTGKATVLAVSFGTHRLWACSQR